ncbi:MAG: methyltransferase domain-containing protein [Pseudomonadota bacterium]
MSRQRDDTPIRSRDVRRRFERAAASFDDGDFLHQRCFDGLIDRLEPMQLKPRRIVDIGCGTGSRTRALAKRYRRSQILGIDLALGMLRQSVRNRSRFSRIREVQADAQALPLRTGIADMVIANLTPVWFSHPSTCFAEAARVLREEGLFVFSSLGPDSLVELRAAWGSADVDAGPHVLPFADMHNTGDALVRAGLRDPVLDVEHVRLAYDEPAGLYRDLTLAGGRNVVRQRRASLTGKARFKRFEEAVAAIRKDGKIEVSMELVFGHAWGGGPRRPPGEYRVDPGGITRMRRNR